LTIPIESPETIVPSLRTLGVISMGPVKCATIYPSTQTDHTSVLSPRVLSVVSLFVTLPVAKSHFRILLSAHPVTSQSSDQSSSFSSSELSSDSGVIPAEVRGIGGPQAMLSRRDLTFPSLRRCERPSCSVDNSWIEPSSHPRAIIVDLGFAETDQMAPPLEFIVLLVNYVNISDSRCIYPGGCLPVCSLLQGPIPATRFHRQC